jgi:hypothetical protein
MDTCRRRGSASACHASRRGRRQREELIRERLGDAVFTAAETALASAILLEAGHTMIQPAAVVTHSDPDIMGGTPVFVGVRVPLCCARSSGK